MATQAPHRPDGRSEDVARERGSDLRGEPADRCALRVDLGGKASIPAHDDVATVVDPVDDPAIARAEPGIVARVTRELDPHPDRDPGSDTRRKGPGTLCVHGFDIGFAAQMLDPPPEEFTRRRPLEPAEVARCRRAAPNSTA